MVWGLCSEPMVSRVEVQSLLVSRSMSLPVRLIADLRTVLVLAIGKTDKARI